MSGVLVVAGQELRLRLRAGRWRLLLALWVGVLALFTLLLAEAVDEDLPGRGAVVFGGLSVLVLTLALLVVPSLAAQAVNGDRERGTLAVLQVTRLSAVQIVLGKLLAAWGSALLLLVLALPLSLYAASLGGVRVEQVVVVTAVLALLLGSVVALSLWLSTVLLRTTTSAVLAYLLVFALAGGTPIAFGLATALTVETVEEVCLPGGVDCFTSQRVRTDRTWWLLAPNPYVVLADASPVAEEQSSLDPLGALGRELRGVRRGPEALQTPGPVWTWGLAVHAGLASGALLSATRRLRTPTRELPRGARVS